MTAVLRCQRGVALVAPQRRWCEIAALAVVRQPRTQKARESMSVRIADTAGFDLAHLRGVHRRCLPSREILRAILQTAVRSRHAPPALPSDGSSTCCDLTERSHVGISGC